LVGGVRREAALVADGGGPDAGLLPERLLLAPEAAEGELGDLEALGIWAGDRRAEDGVVAGLQDRRGTAGQGGVGGGHGRRAEELHGVMLRASGPGAMTTG